MRAHSCSRKVRIGIGLSLVIAAGAFLAAAQEKPGEAGKGAGKDRAKKEIVVALIGDSTVEDAGGWGKAFAGRFGAGVKVLNFAVGGRSSKSWYDEKRLPAVLKAKPDYVFIQFGHNDQPGKGPERETDPKTTYREYLILYITEFQKIGAKPIIVSSVSRRSFGKDGKIKSSLDPWAEAAKAVATEAKVPFIDLHAASIELYNKVGPEGAKVFTRGGTDGTHFSPKGGEAIADLVVAVLRTAEPALAAHLKPDRAAKDTAPAATTTPAATTPAKVAWVLGTGDSLRQRPEFYGSAEAICIAENVLLWQRESGGWPKNYDRAAMLNDADRKKPAAEKKAGDATFDNGSTHSEVAFLAKVYAATKDERYASAARKGIEFMLAAQYANGGWPQYPNASGYPKHITFNDGAMIGVMTVLRDAAQDKAAYPFVDEALRKRGEAAVAKGIDCILKCQIVVNGKKTAWCQQHDEKTLAPANARSYELASICSAESVGIVEFLMQIEKPSPEVIDAVESSVAWFNASKLTGIREVKKEDKAGPPGWDKVIVSDPAAPPMWARFYDLKTGKTFYCDRDGVPKPSISEIGRERRTGYSWLGYYPARMLEKDYPAWQKKHGRE